MNTRPRSHTPDGAGVSATRAPQDDLFDDSDFWEGFVESVSVIARRRIPQAPDGQSPSGAISERTAHRRVVKP